MAPEGTTSPAAESCLISSYASRKQKGGTLIDETVLDMETHERQMQNPDSYRPAECRCGGCHLHVHDVRTRKPRGTAGPGGLVTVMVFLCLGFRPFGAAGHLAQTGSLPGGMKLTCQRCGHLGGGDLEFIWFSRTFEVKPKGSDARAVERTLRLCPDCSSALGSDVKCVAFLKKQLKG